MHYSDFPINLFEHIYLMTLMLLQEMLKKMLQLFKLFHCIQFFYTELAEGRGSSFATKNCYLESRSVFRTPSNIYDEAFLRK